MKCGAREEKTGCVCERQVGHSGAHNQGDRHWLDTLVPSKSEGTFGSLEAVRLWLDGVELEFQMDSINSWEPIGPRGDWTHHIIPSVFCQGYRFRRKQSKKCVPLDPDDVPPGSVIRTVEQSSKWAAVLRVTNDGVQTLGASIEFQKLMYRYEIKRPGENWEPCWKEVEE